MAGTFSPDKIPGVGSPSSIVSFVRTMTFDYDWISGDWMILIRILNVVEAVVLAVVTWEVFGNLFGMFK
jgi:hypothetical protein